MTISIDKAWFEKGWSAKGLSLRKFAMSINMDPSALSRALNGQRGIKIADVDKIAAGMNVSRFEVLRHLGGEESLELPAGASRMSEHRRPSFGFMKGLLTVEEGYDLTSPSDESWESGPVVEEGRHG
jgi:transcriptional regulator with XRE-family HTH domain